MELDYRDLLAAANEAFFHRAYPIALRLYLELRQKILVQSHPELPTTPGIIDSMVFDPSIIEWERIVELSRRVLLDLDPGRPVKIPADLVATTFVAYIPHLFFSVLPIAIADTYKALGQWSQAVAHYTSVLAYPYLNVGIEGVDLWVRLASTQLKWGEELFRRSQPTAARPHFAQIVTIPYEIPATSPLYQPAGFSVAKAQAGDAVKLLKGEAVASLNPRVADFVTSAARQLLKIDAGLNILGLDEDYAPILRFTYLQSTSTRRLTGRPAWPASCTIHSSWHWSTRRGLTRLCRTRSASRSRCVHAACAWCCATTSAPVRSSTPAPGSSATRRPRARGRRC